MATQPTKRGRPTKREKARSYLNGQLLIAMPTMQDPRFARSVVYMCTHTKDGAMGLIINQRADNISFPELLVQARIVKEGTEDSVPPAVQAMHVHVGGPVETGRGFVLHTAEFQGKDSTVSIDDTMSLTATIDILRAIAKGRGPARSLLALGCAGWSAGQLDREMQANGWLHCPSDPDLVFDPELDRKYERALARIGVNPSHLVSQAGHA
jgi:putative transcriptional regulator